MGLAARAVEALGHVEDDVGAGEGKFLREERVGFEPDDPAEETEGLLHRADGGWVVPLGVRVGRGARFGFLVVCETDSHVVSGYLLQKRPLWPCGLEQRQRVVQYQNKKCRRDMQ